MQKMSGLKKDWQLELRKFPLSDKVDTPNFESVTIEKLNALATENPVKLQGFNCYSTGLSKIELFFTNGLESADYQLTYFKTSHAKSEQTCDTSKQIKKISVKLYASSSSNDIYVNGIKFLDKNDNELVKWEGHKENGTWETKEIPDGFEIIGLYGDTRKEYG